MMYYHRVFLSTNSAFSYVISMLHIRLLCANKNLLTYLLTYQRFSFLGQEWRIKDSCHCWLGKMSSLTSSVNLLSTLYCNWVLSSLSSLSLNVNHVSVTFLKHFSDSEWSLRADVPSENKASSHKIGNNLSLSHIVASLAVRKWRPLWDREI